MDASNLKINSVNEIRDPTFLKDLNYSGCEELAKLIRENILLNVSKNGGHLSSNLGTVELEIALHRNFDFKTDKLLFDVGHQAYTHKILTGRSLENLRKKNGIDGFIKTSESPYDVFEAGHSSTSLSAASAFAKVRDINSLKYHIVDVIGDASIANGVAVEALNLIPSSHNKVIIILNDNGMGISQPVGGISQAFRNLQSSDSYGKVKSKVKRSLAGVKFLYKIARSIKNFLKRHLIKINTFDTLGYLYLGIVDGHNFKELDKALLKAKRANRSVVVHVRTIKGKGYQAAENDSLGIWHGVGPFDIKKGELTNSPVDSWPSFYSELIKERLENDPLFYVIVPGTMVGSDVAVLEKKYPGRVIDVGIAEEHAIIYSGILAKQNLHVCVLIYSTFMQRGYDEIIHDIARIHAPVTFLVDRSGLVGEDGETHQGLYDSSFLLNIPNVRVAMASTKEEGRKIFTQSFLEKEATFIRFPKMIISDNLDEPSIAESIDNENTKISVICVGPLASELKNICQDLDIKIFVPVMLKPFSDEFIYSILNSSKLIIYTPFETENGYAQSLSKELLKAGYKNPIFVKAVPNVFVGTDSIRNQLESFGLLPTQIKEFIISISK